MKISVIGAGQVGATTAQQVLIQNLAEQIVLVDIVDGMAAGKALDLSHLAAIDGYKAKITGSEKFDPINKSDIVVVTAGLTRKPGMTREDLLKKNADIIRDIAGQITVLAPGAIVIVVTNPLDTMTQLFRKVSGFPANRVIGMAGVLDSGRFCGFVSEAAGVSPDLIEVMVLGSHGDLMVPLISSARVDGKPLTEVLPADKIAGLVKRTKDAGAEIVGLLKTSAYYGPGTAVAQMVKAIVNPGQRKVLPVCVMAKGEYGLRNIYIGLPARLGKGGVEKIMEIPLNPVELEMLTEAGISLKRNWNEINR